MEGEFVEGSLVKGVKVKSSGDVFQGEFKYGLLNGEGTHECKAKRSVYSGHFVDGLKHGVGTEIFYNKRGSVLSKYNGMYCNGKRSGLGRLSFCDVGFSNDLNSFEKSDLHLKGFWLGGQPKAGGLISKDDTRFNIPTIPNPSSKFRWLHRLKRIEDQKENDTQAHEMKINRTGYAFRYIIQMKKQSLYDHHYQSVKSMLFGRNRGKIQTKTRDNHSQILPSKSKYYSQRKVNKPPSSIHEALNNEIPGLQMVERSSQDERGIMGREMVDLIRTKWSEMGVHIFQTAETKIIQKEYAEMEEEWVAIDVNKIRDSVRAKEGTKE